MNDERIKEELMHTGMKQSLALSMFIKNSIKTD